MNIFYTLTLSLAVAGLSLHGAEAVDEYNGYEIIAFDRPEGPKYGSGWTPGSGGDVEFSGWDLYSKGGYNTENNPRVFYFGSGNLVPCGGMLGGDKIFVIKSERSDLAYAQRRLHQKIFTGDILSSSLVFHSQNEEAGQAGMVIGQRGDDGTYRYTVALVRRDGYYLLRDGEEGSLVIDMKPDSCPIGVSYVFEENGNYTLQINEMKPGGRVLDIGPRKARNGGGTGNYSLSYFAEDGMALGFNDLQIERRVR